MINRRHMIALAAAIVPLSSLNACASIRVILIGINHPPIPIFIELLCWGCIAVWVGAIWLAIIEPILDAQKGKTR